MVILLNILILAWKRGEMTTICGIIGFCFSKKLLFNIDGKYLLAVVGIADPNVND